MLKYRLSEYVDHHLEWLTMCHFFSPQETIPFSLIFLFKNGYFLLRLSRELQTEMWSIIFQLNGEVSKHLSDSRIQVVSNDLHHAKNMRRSNSMKSRALYSGCFLISVSIWSSLTTEVHAERCMGFQFKTSLQNPENHF